MQGTGNPHQFLEMTGITNIPQTGEQVLDVYTQTQCQFD